MLNNHQSRFGQLIDRLKISNWVHRQQARGELLSRYRNTCAFWWQRREDIKAPDLSEHEAEFLPANLSLQNKPVSPTGRLVAITLILLLLALLIWSIVGKMDIVVLGQGKIITRGQTKTIASVELAKVVGLYVEEGQAVKAGQLLISLDSRGSQSEQSKAEGDRQLALLQIERSKALLRSLSTLQDPVLSPMAEIDTGHYQNEARHLQDLWRDYMSKRGRVLSQIKRYEDALPLVVQRAADYARLAKDRDISEHAYSEKEQARIDLQGQLDDAKTQLTALTTETAKNAQNDLFQATKIWSGAVQDRNKAQARTDQLDIYSPVDGVVQQLTVHTLGGVVSPAQPLMIIVPSKNLVELEAYIENKDIGFIQEGQVAKVKIEAFDFTKYGTVPALISHVSRDAIDRSGNGTGQLASNEGSDKNNAGSGGKGLVYAIKVSLNKTSMMIDSKEKPLTPGMSGSVEIKTGERRIIAYVLSPLIKHTNESLRER